MRDGEDGAEKRRQLIAELQQSIGLFSFQHGVAANRVVEFTTYITNQHALLTEKAELGVLEGVFYQEAIRALREESFTDLKESTSQFRFPEDKELHDQLQKLPFGERNAVVLTTFHGITMGRIAALTDEKKDAIAHALEQGMSSLGGNLGLASEDQLEQRLELLKKSYDRLTFLVPVEENNVEPEQESAPEEETDKTQPAISPKKPASKKAAAVWTAAIIGIGAIIGSTFLLEEPSRGSEAVESSDDYVSDAQIEEWKQEYKHYRATAHAKLGLTEERLEQLNYVKTADAAFEKFFSKAELKEMRMDLEQMEQLFKGLMMQIHVPGDMSDFRYVGLLKGEEQIDFIHSYANKTQELMNLLNILFFQYAKELSYAERDGQLSVDELMTNLEDYPEEVTRILEQQYNAGVRVDVHPNRPTFLAKRDVQPLYTMPVLSMDWNHIYMEILSEAPYLDGTGIILDHPDALAMHLSYMEMLLADELMEPHILDELEVWFEQLFWYVLKSPDLSEDESELDAERKKLWNMMLSSSQDPMYYILHPIVGEMEASGWKESASLDELAYNDISVAIEMKQRGELSALMPFADRMVKERFVDLMTFEWESMTPLYEAYSEEYSDQALAESDPLDIYLLYHFANRMDDPETMWHLLEDNAARPDKEEFIRDWERLPDIQDKLRWLQTFEGNSQRNADQMMVMIELGYNNLADNEEMGRSGPALVTRAEGPWKLKHQWSEHMTSGAEMDAFKEQIRSLYSSLQNGDESVLQEAEPLVLGALYVYAEAEKDWDVLQRLMYREDGLEVLTEEEMEERLLVQDPSFSFESIETMTFNTEVYMMEQDKVYGSFVLSVPTRQSYYNMIKTEEGWRLDAGYW
ncbi:hypothetical protein [Planomicrobium sp. YIM 101495]|uniref:hypothetical protein n=1 Tax=Planomicrobium sp. YIM 101495 TaxID=2665160 RepID=UPI0012B84936|nr:hypothetical protein [Planomicrobium sp. YIM 101495]MTD31814.1 hypothetical protein [Planomicrobium sp. YIM 101495]